VNDSRQSFFKVTNGITKITAMCLWKTNEYKMLTVVDFFVAAYLPLLASVTVVLSAAIFLIIVGVFYVFFLLRLRVIRNELLDSGMHWMH
jgi:hypothetical protein